MWYEFKMRMKMEDSKKLEGKLAEVNPLDLGVAVAIELQNNDIWALAMDGCHLQKMDLDA